MNAAVHLSKKNHGLPNRSRAAHVSFCRSPLSRGSKFSHSRGARAAQPRPRPVAGRGRGRPRRPPARGPGGTRAAAGGPPGARRARRPAPPLPRRGPGRRRPRPRRAGGAGARPPGPPRAAGRARPGPGRPPRPGRRAPARAGAPGCARAPRRARACGARAHTGAPRSLLIFCRRGFSRPRGASNLPPIARFEVFASPGGNDDLTRLHPPSVKQGYPFLDLGTIRPTGPLARGSPFEGRVTPRLQDLPRGYSSPCLCAGPRQCGRAGR